MEQVETPCTTKVVADAKEEELARNAKFEQQYDDARKRRFRENDEVKVTTIPFNASQLPEWILVTQKSVMSASGQPFLCKSWLDRIHSATSIDDLEDDEDFDSLSQKSGFFSALPIFW